MHTLHDYDRFTGLLDQLCATWDRPPAKDEMAKAYWSALKDSPFDEIERNVRRLIRTSTRESKFPKPGELLDETPKEATSAGAAAFADAEQRSIRNLEELKRTDADAWRREVRLRYLDRRIATEWEGSTIYAQAKAEWLQLRGLA